MRLEREGYAERETKRKYQLDKKIPKKVLKAVPRPLGRASVVAGLEAATGAEQIGLRSLRHQALGGVQHLDHVVTVGGDQGDTHRGATVRSWSPTSAAETANRRCSSATIGRTRDRFSLREWTSPRSRSSSSHPIHTSCSMAAGPGGVRATLATP